MNTDDIRQFTSWLGKRNYRSRLKRLGIERIREIAAKTGRRVEGRGRSRRRGAEMAVSKRGNTWWYKFYFAGRFVRESAKSTSKTVAKNAEKQRRRDLEQAYNNISDSRDP